MALITVPASNRYKLVTRADDGTIIVLGRATTPSWVGVFEIQFDPDINFAGQFVVMGHVGPPGPNIVPGAFLPISYRNIVVNNVASDWAVVSSPISTPSIIQVPSSGISIGLMTTCTQGTCGIISYDTQGASSM